MKICKGPAQPPSGWRELTVFAGLGVGARGGGAPPSRGRRGRRQRRAAVAHGGKEEAHAATVYSPPTRSRTAAAGSATGSTATRRTSPTDSVRARSGTREVGGRHPAFQHACRRLPTWGAWPWRLRRRAVTTPSAAVTALPAAVTAGRPPRPWSQNAPTGDTSRPPHRPKATRWQRPPASQPADRRGAR